MKRRTRKLEQGKTNTQQPHAPHSLAATLDNFGARERRHSDSADIAAERPASGYPMPRKSEGKILRPQYKEILRGEYDVTKIKKPSN